MGGEIYAFRYRRHFSSTADNYCSIVSNYSKTRVTFPIKVLAWASMKDEAASVIENALRMDEPWKKSNSYPLPWSRSLPFPNNFA